MYHFKHRIIHQDERVAEKVNFFADYLFFSVANLGTPFGKGLENHVSLLEKIQFQLTHYSPRYSKKYLNHYFENSYLCKKDPLIEEYYLSEWKLFNKHKQKFLVDDSQHEREALTSSIKSLLKKMDGTLFNNALTRIISAILCVHPLDKHEHVAIFQYNTDIIISEFLFAGFLADDILGVFNKILSKDIKLEDNKVKTLVPLPESLLQLKQSGKTEEFYNKASEYLKNRTLSQQFEGIYHLFKNALKPKTYVFRLNNIAAYKPVSLTMDEVLISNTLKKDYVRRGTTREEYRNFFHGKGKLFGQVTISENNNDVGKVKAKKKILEALNYLNASLKRNATIDDTDYIVKDEDTNIRNTHFTGALHPSDVVTLQKQYLPAITGKTGNLIVQRLLEIDRIYFRAASSESSEEKLVHYWRYLESFFESKDYASEDVRDRVSKILSTHYEIESLLYYFNLSAKILRAGYESYRRETYNDYFKIPQDELYTLMEPHLFSDIDLSKINGLINHPFVSKEISGHINRSKVENSQLLEKFFYRLLTEVYEQRNFIEHSGVSLDKSIDKVLLSLPTCVSSFRNLVIQQVQKKEYSSFRDVLNDLAA